jgi:hypothetical protein
VKAADTWPASAALLPAHVLTALAAWCGGRSAVITAEMKRRHDYHAELAEQYAAETRRSG